MEKAGSGTIKLALQMNLQRPGKLNGEKVFLTVFPAFVFY